MKKQIVSFLMAMFLGVPSVNSLKFEVIDKELTFIVDDKDNSAVLRDIYIPLKTKNSERNHGTWHPQSHRQNLECNPSKHIV